MVGIGDFSDKNSAALGASCPGLGTRPAAGDQLITLAKWAEPLTLATSPDQRPTPALVATGGGPELVLMGFMIRR